jgi:hypothetical protein
MSIVAVIETHVQVIDPDALYRHAAWIRFEQGSQKEIATLAEALLEVTSDGRWPPQECGYEVIERTSRHDLMSDSWAPKGKEQAERDRQVYAELEKRVDDFDGDSYDCVLDDTVHDLASQDASRANNGGADSQLLAIYRACGLDEAPKLVEQVLAEAQADREETEKEKKP